MSEYDFNPDTGFKEKEQTEKTDLFIDCVGLHFLWSLGFMLVAHAVFIFVVFCKSTFVTGSPASVNIPISFSIGILIISPIVTFLFIEKIRNYYIYHKVMSKYLLKRRKKKIKDMPTSVLVNHYNSKLNNKDPRVLNKVVDEMKEYIYNISVELSDRMLYLNRDRNYFLNAIEELEKANKFRKRSNGTELPLYQETLDTLNQGIKFIDDTKKYINRIKQDSFGYFLYFDANLLLLKTSSNAMVIKDICSKFEKIVDIFKNINHTIEMNSQVNMVDIELSAEATAKKYSVNTGLI
jgi:hypothetical protein